MLVVVMLPLFHAYLAVILDPIAKRGLVASISNLAPPTGTFFCFELKL
jgi:hypothetical protein